MRGEYEKQLEIILRGVADTFPEGELEAKLKKSLESGRPLRVKLGVDPTGADLHLGHIIPLLKLRAFQDLGHQAVLIIGDYTGMVGDPSGRNKARPQLSHEEVLRNAETYQEQAFKILDPAKTEVVYNGSWFEKMGFNDVIRLLSGMTLARMLEREDFSNRFKSESPIGLHELVYPLMQGYDSAMIECDVELGGTDQKFNILVGRDIQKEMGQEPQVGVCLPILIGTDGVEKMSKSLGNYIGVNEPPEEMFGKVMSIKDELMEVYFTLLTTVPVDEIRRMNEQMKAGAVNPRDIKFRLAREIVSRFWGAEGAERGEAHFKSVFVDRQTPEEIPEIRLNTGSMDNGKMWIVKLLVTAGLASSNSEARRLIEQGGVRIDGETVNDSGLDVEIRDGMIVQVGKRRFVKLIRS